MEREHVSLNEFKEFLAQNKDTVFHMNEPGPNPDEVGCALVQFGRSRGMSRNVEAAFVSMTDRNSGRSIVIDDLPKTLVSYRTWPNNACTGQQLFDSLPKE